jgi:DNA-binding GntR family transcriptional regulator
VKKAMSTAEPKNIREIIYSQLKKDIACGRIGPGEKLVEANLGERFNCSRTPVRETLLQLQSEHYVIYVPNKGATVAKLSVAKIDEIFSVRTALESHAVLEAANRFSESDLRKMTELHEIMQKNASDGNYEAYAENNTLFHLYCAKVAGNETLYEIIQDLLNRLNPYEYYIAVLPGNLSYWLSGHNEVIEALKDKDFSKAAAGIGEHIEDARNITQSYLKKLPGLFAQV